MQTYQCSHCGAKVFFENLSCLTCGNELGYLPEKNKILTLDESDAGIQGCANRKRIGCNWLLIRPLASSQQAAAPPESASLCECCRYTKTIPPDDATSQQAWRKLEQAKRYLFYSLRTLQLPMPSREQQPDGGLAFEFLAQTSQQQNVKTGHTTGVITINIAEADDVQREQRRTALHEPYRTLLGHLRHEVGHFYWDQLIANSTALDGFRTLFGDERQDYAAALQQHYQSADGSSWQANHISHYASAHPWEDWAETWAHYLHINDALDTAADWRVELAADGARVKPIRINKNTSDAELRDRLIKEWLPLSQYLNAACRSLGEADAYPFTLPPVVVDKLVFVHAAVRTAQEITTAN